MKCPECDTELVSDKFSDVVHVGDFDFDVYITACPECRYVDDKYTWVE